MDEELQAAVPELDERSRRALAAAEAWVGGDIQGVAIGADESGEPEVVVYAVAGDSGAVRGLPAECQGLPVRIESGDAFTTEG